MSSSWFNDIMSSDQLRALGRCPVCHVQNDVKEVKVIKEKLPEVLFLHHCPRCQSNILFCLVSEPWGVGSVGLVTDLESEEVEKYLANNQNLNDDAILNYYQAYVKCPNFLLQKIISRV